MKMREANRIMENGIAALDKGFMVSFEWKKGSLLQSDHFPDKHGGESLIGDLETAWKLAEKFADATKGKCVNIYVIDESFSPASGYSERRIENR